MGKVRILTVRPKKYRTDTEIKKRRLVFVDLEFSGLEMNHEILQIGCVVVSQPASPGRRRVVSNLNWRDGSDFRVVHEWQTRVKPRHIEDADKNALKIIGYSPKKWKDAISLEQALKAFNAIAKNGVLVGYNVVWDFLFLKKSFFETGIKPAFHWQVLDVLPMVYEELYRTRLTGFRMREVVEYLQVKGTHWHDALVDARATYEIFKKVMQRHKSRGRCE